MASNENLDNQSSQPPSDTTVDFRALVEHLVQPVVIMDRAGKICFMNPQGKRLLAHGLKERVEAHLSSPAQRKPASQVRFRVEGAGDLILQIRLSDMPWQGQPAMQVSLTDVTPYAANEERFAQEMAKLKERQHAIREWKPRLEAQVRSLAEERDAVYASSSQRLAQETARFQKSQREAQAQRDRLEAQVKELRAELAQLREAAPKAEPTGQELVQARRTIDELTAARRELEARAGQSAAQLRQLQEAAAQAESRLAAAQQQSRSQARDEAQQLRQQIAEGERAMAESAERNRRLDGQLSQLAAAHEDATRRLQDATAARDRSQEEIARLQQQLEAADRAQEESRAARAALEARLQPLTEQLAQSGAQLRQKVAELDRSREAGSAMERELAASRRVLEESRAGRQALEERAREQADELLKSNAQIQAQVAEADKAKAEHERLQQQGAELRAARDAERGQFQAQVKELSAVQAQLKAELDQERAERKKALEEAARLQQELSKSARAQGERSAQRDQLQQQVDELSAMRTRSEAEIERARAEIARFQRAVAEAETQADRARRQIQEEISRRQEAETSSAKLLEEIETLKRALDDRRRDADALAGTSAAELEKAGQQFQSASAERRRLEEKIRALESEETALRSEFEWRAAEHAEALAAAHAQLEKETLERIQVEVENEKLRREIAESKAAAAEPAENGGEADARAAEAPQSADPVQRQLAEGREARVLNKLLRKKLTEVRHAALQGQIERAALAQQVQSQAVALEKARTELRQEAAGHQRTKEENQQLRQNLAEATDAAQTLKAGQEAPEDPAKKGADKTEESWTKRLFAPRKNPAGS